MVVHHLQFVSIFKFCAFWRLPLLVLTQILLAAAVAWLLEAWLLAARASCIILSFVERLRLLLARDELLLPAHSHLGLVDLIILVHYQCSFRVAVARHLLRSRPVQRVQMLDIGAYLQVVLVRLIVEIRLVACRSRNS